MVWLMLILGFFLFMAVIGVAHAMDRHAEERYGYRPFALPNLALMLIPHGILVAWAVGWGQDARPSLSPGLVWALGALAVAALVFLLAVLQRRTSLGIALAGAGLMLVAAPVLVLSMLFRNLTDAPSGP